MAKECVLMIEDDEEMIALGELILAKEGLEVRSATSGAAGLRILSEHHVDLVLLDIMMEEMDGWQVLDAVNGDETLADVPVLFVSAQDPADQTPSSPFLLATMGEGLTLRKLLDCSLQVSARLLQP